ncbi:unnamed protein product, partial [Scytosiphon promiscuus]
QGRGDAVAPVYGFASAAPLQPRAAHSRRVYRAQNAHGRYLPCRTSPESFPSRVCDKIMAARSKRQLCRVLSSCCASLSTGMLVAGYARRGVENARHQVAESSFVLQKALGVVIPPPGRGVEGKKSRDGGYQSRRKDDRAGLTLNRRIMCVE